MLLELREFVESYSSNKTKRKEMMGFLVENCFIAGGSVVSKYQKKKVKDLDIYFKSTQAKNDFMDMVNADEFYATREDFIDYLKVMIEIEDPSKDSGVEKRRQDEILDLFDRIKDDRLREIKWQFENGYEKVLVKNEDFFIDGDMCLGNKSITFIADNSKERNLPVQFVLRFCGEIEEVLDKTFDLQHCKVAFDFATRDYVFPPESLKALIHNEIQYVNSYYPLSSLKRLFKYKERGMFLRDNVILDVLKDIKELDLEDPFILKDQMIGYYEDFDWDKVFGGECSRGEQSCEEDFFDEMLS